MKPLIRHFWKENVIGLMLLIALALINTATSLINIELFNALVALDMTRFFQIVLILFTAFLGLLAVTYGKIRYFAYLNQKQATYLRSQIMEKISQQSYQTATSRETQTYVSWFTNDIKQIENQTLDPFYDLLGGIIQAIISALALISLHWSLIVLTLVEIAILMLLPKLFNKGLMQANQEVSEENEQFTKRVSNYFLAYNTFFAYRQFRYMQDKIKQASEQLGQKQMAYQEQFARVAIISGLGNVISQVSLFALTGYLALIQVVSIGTLTATASLAGNIFNIIGNLSQYLATIQSTQPIFDKFAALTADTTGDQAIDWNQGITLTDLAFQYDEKPILQDVSFRFEPTKKYAIIGASGKGKSTLFNLLTAKLRDYNGTIQYGQSDLSTVSIDTLYENLVYVDQHAATIDCTIRENLIFDRNIDDAKLWQTLVFVELDQVVRHLPQQLDTPLGDKGKLLSGGQLQRLAIARALLSDKNYLLLDESTSSLDQKARLALEQKLLNLPDKTILMITHHLDDSIKVQLDDVLYL